MNEKLVAARKSHNWSQTEVSIKLGIDLRTYQRWERGNSTPQPYHRDKLCELFSGSLQELGYDFAAIATESPSPIIVNGAQRNPIESWSALTPNRDWASWFGQRLAIIFGMISRWGNNPVEEIQTIVDQEITMIDEQLNQHPEENTVISRRQALASIAALPLALLAFKPVGPISDAINTDFLSQSAASLTACWHLLRGPGGITTVDEILPQFLPLLRTYAQRPSSQQTAAARLAAQAGILQGILAMHHLNFTAREAACKDAARYAAIAGDQNLQAAALTYLGYTYSFCYIPRKPEKGIQAFNQALPLVSEDAPLLKSNILMGLAEAYAQCKESKQALHYIGLAQSNFPTYPENDPTYIYGDCSMHVLYQWEGKMYLELSEHYQDQGYQRKAASALLLGAGVQSISERSTAETVIYQADAARLLGDINVYTETLTDAVEMSIQLGSKKRFQEALQVFEKTPEKWQREQKVRQVAASLFGRS